jgi:hypothetical protein
MWWPGSSKSRPADDIGLAGVGIDLDLADVTAGRDFVPMRSY